MYCMDDEAVTPIKIPMLSLMQPEVDPTEDYPLYVKTNTLLLDWSNFIPTKTLSRYPTWPILLPIIDITGQTLEG